MDGSDALLCSMTRKWASAAASGEPPKYLWCNRKPQLPNNNNKTENNKLLDVCGSISKRWAERVGRIGMLFVWTVDGIGDPKMEHPNLNDQH